MKKIVGIIAAAEHGKDTCAEYLVNTFGWIRMAFADTLYREVADAFSIVVYILQDRKTKESDVSWLALKHCSDLDFIKVVGLCTGVPGAVIKASLKYLKTGKSTKDVPMREVQLFLNKPRAPRLLLQLWGTEYRRKFGGSDNYWLDKVASQLENTESNVVITDCRFPNEADLISSLGGTLVRVVRPALVERDKASKRVQHVSEQALKDRPTKATLVNEENNLSILHKQLDSLVEQL